MAAAAAISTPSTTRRRADNPVARVRSGTPTKASTARLAPSSKGELYRCGLRYGPEEHGDGNGGRTEAVCGGAASFESGQEHGESACHGEEVGSHQGHQAAPEQHRAQWREDNGRARDPSPYVELGGVVAGSDEQVGHQYSAQPPAHDPGQDGRDDAPCGDRARPAGRHHDAVMAARRGPQQWQSPRRPEQIAPTCAPIVRQHHQVGGPLAPLPVPEPGRQQSTQNPQPTLVVRGEGATRDAHHASLPSEARTLRRRSATVTHFWAAETPSAVSR